MKKNFKALIKQINTFVFDVDGVFTDGTLLISENGELLRKMNVKDGLAVKMALDKNYRVCIITGGTNQDVKKRFKDLGITDIYLGSHYKKDDLLEYFDSYEINPEEVLYMGDDLPDIEAMSLCGLSSCPQDAVSEVKAQADYISHINGGAGCVRDVIRQVMAVRGDWPSTSESTKANG